ncbi:hypothetical protein KCP78_22665 [Salmonella enterica subsp. enterica]|nr:hypothetical protein KCP78_22665 [Salmonella enterica subsp. enterica]
MRTHRPGSKSSGIRLAVAVAAAVIILAGPSPQLRRCRHKSDGDASGGQNPVAICAIPFVRYALDER